MEQVYRIAVCLCTSCTATLHCFDAASEEGAREAQEQLRNIEPMDC
jgi:hypothetical protein